MLFSDMLGNRELSTSVGVNGGAKDISAQATYLNRNHRWNWGAFGENVPLLSGTITQATGTASGQPVLAQATTLQRQTYSSVGGLVAYPFSRATRLEISASGQRVGFGEQVQTQVFDLNSGQQISNKTSNVGGLPSLRLAQVSGALVRDTAAFGATGPILGGRLHLEAAPTFGDLQMVDVTADVRRYVMPVRPITLAGRVLHLGRYGSGAEDQRLVPLFLGYPTLVRGYDIGSFTASDCAATANGSCPELDELFGSRLLVLNGEVRAPLVGLFQGRLNYGPIPAELFAFVDSGHAWTRQADSIARRWVTSAGIGVRVNLFGYAVAEFNAVRPLNRAGRGWGFVFNLRPGF